MPPFHKPAWSAQCCLQSGPHVKPFLPLSEVTRDLQRLLQPDGALRAMPPARVTSPLVLLESRDLLMRLADSTIRAQAEGWKGSENQKLYRAVMVRLAS